MTVILILGWVGVVVDTAAVRWVIDGLRVVRVPRALGGMIIVMAMGHDLRRSSSYVTLSLVLVVYNL